MGMRSHLCKLETVRLDLLANKLNSLAWTLITIDVIKKKIMLCWLKTLCRLNQCKLKENCCADLATVLSSGTSHLKTLDLSNNSLKDSGVSLLTSGLRNPHCTLETLRSVQSYETEDCGCPSYMISSVLSPPTPEETMSFGAELVKCVVLCLSELFLETTTCC